MRPKMKVWTAGVEVPVGGAGGLYSFVYNILWRKAYDVLCKNVENDGLRSSYSALISTNLNMLVELNSGAYRSLAADSDPTWASSVITCGCGLHELWACCMCLTWPAVGSLGLGPSPRHQLLQCVTIIMMPGRTRLQSARPNNASGDPRDSDDELAVESGTLAPTLGCPSTCSDRVAAQLNTAINFMAKVWYLWRKGVLDSGWARRHEQQTLVQDADLPKSTSTSFVLPPNFGKRTARWRMGGTRANRMYTPSTPQTSQLEWKKLACQHFLPTLLGSQDFVRVTTVCTASNLGSENSSSLSLLATLWTSTSS
ncbi:hypothetical protein F5888DRAFT_1634851 [Russula emetica]|nr:hypothetical protein F5888DRAFT_1634851 [Russula emetica]